jgi:hypothetical protein
MQDAAANGEQMRKVQTSDGSVVTASVSIQKFPKSNQLWGYLRFKTGSKTKQFYIGRVSAETPEESLAIGWKLVREKQVLEKAGWSWLIPSDIESDISRSRK